MDGPFPETEHRDYATLYLSNGLLVLLISTLRETPPSSDSVSDNLDLPEEEDDKRLLQSLVTRNAAAVALANAGTTTATATTTPTSSSLLYSDVDRLHNHLGGGRRLSWASWENSNKTSWKGEEVFNNVSERSKLSRRSTTTSFRGVSARFGYQAMLDNGSTGAGGQRLSNGSGGNDSSGGGNNNNNRRNSSLPGSLGEGRGRGGGQVGGGSKTSSFLAAASLCVNVGSFSDPGSVQGLAHVVEHMVFMGSKKYPGENEWDQFVSISGGDSNACTEAERTTFHFSVPRESFEDALDRFSHFFIAPVLRKESLERELAAIDSEFHDSAADAGYVLAQVATCTAKRGPFSQFACGNAEALGSVPNLHEFVEAFFHTHYVAPNMTAVLFSSDSLDTLTRIAENTFGRIPRQRNLERLVVKVPSRFSPLDSRMPFLSLKEKQVLGEEVVPGTNGCVAGCVFIVDPPTGHPHTLQITWQLPSQRSAWKNKPLDYIAHAIGHETRGSVLSECKARGWATSLAVASNASNPEASSLENNAACTLLEMYVELTDLGVEHWIDVVSAVFEYIGMLKKTGVERRLHEELRKCALASFVFRESLNPGILVEMLAQRLCSDSGLPPSRVINGGELVFDFDSSAIVAVLEELIPDNARVDLITRFAKVIPRWGSTNVSESITEKNNAKAESGETTIKAALARRLRSRVFAKLTKNARMYQEAWYGTTFCAVFTPPEVEKLWKNALSKGENKQSLFARLPIPNEYICEDFSVKPALRPAAAVAPDFVGRTFDFTSGTKRRFTVVTVLGPRALVQYADTNERKWLSYQPLTNTPRLGNDTFTKCDDSVHVNTPLLSEAPALCHDTPHFSMWHLQGGRFDASRCNLRFAFEFPRSLVAPSPLNAAMADLLLRCLNDATVGETYPALLSGTLLATDVVDGNKFVLEYTGFPSTVQVLVERTLPLFLGCAKYGHRRLAEYTKNVQFSSQVEALRAAYVNNELPFSRTLENVLYLDAIEAATKLRAVPLITKEKLHRFAITALSQCRVTGFYYGNVLVSECDKLVKYVEALMSEFVFQDSTNRLGKRQPVEPSVRPTLRVPRVPPPSPATKKEFGTGVAGTCAVYSASGPSSSVLVYLQVDAPGKNHRPTPHDVKSRILCELVAQLMREPLFNALRTQRKLAYHVTCASHEITPPGITGIYFEVQSHQATCLELVDVLDEFLESFENDLRNMPPLEFYRHVRALCLRKLERDASPTSECLRHFGTVISGHVPPCSFEWNRDEEDARVLLSGSITQEDALIFYSTHLRPSAGKRRRLNLLICGAYEVQAGGFAEIAKKLDQLDHAYLLDEDGRFRKRNMVFQDDDAGGVEILATTTTVDNNNTKKKNSVQKKRHWLWPFLV